MSIRVQDLLSTKAKKFGFSEQSADVQQIFIDAFNYTLDDIAKKLTTVSDEITGIGQTVDLDRQLYKGVISIGLDFYMQDLSEYTIQSLAGVDKRYQRKLDLLLVAYLKTQDMNWKFGDLTDE